MDNRKDDVKRTLSGKRYLVLFTVLYALGVYTAVRIPAFYSLSVSSFLVYSMAYFFAAGLLCVGLPFLLKRNSKSHSLRTGVLMLALLLFFLFGLFRTWQVTEIEQKELIACKGRQITLSGKIINEPSKTNSGKNYGLLLQVTNIDDDAVSSGKLQLYVPASDGSSLRQGDTIRCTVTPEQPDGPAFRGGFDYRSYLAQKDCFLIGYTDRAEAADLPQKFSILHPLNTAGTALRGSIHDSIDAVLPPETDANALLKGILTGSKDTLSDEAYRDLSRSGLIHIAAVSGMHVAYLFMMLSFVLSFLRVRKWLMNLIAIPVLVLFAAVSSYTPSVCRAVIMMILFLLSYNLQREPDALTALFASGLILIVWNPYLLFGVSFLLSFSATLSILVFSRLISERLTWIDRLPPRWKSRSIWSYPRQSLAVSIAGMLGISYFVAYFFNIVSFSGLIANIWIIPCTAAVFIVGFANWLIWLILPGAAPVTTGILLRPLLWVVEKSTALFADSVFVLDVPSPPQSFFPIYLILCVILWYCLRPCQSKSDDPANPEPDGGIQPS